MKLLIEAQRAKLIDNGRRQAAVKGTPNELDFEPVVKLFNPCGAATWLLTEIDPSRRRALRRRNLAPSPRVFWRCHVEEPPYGRPNSRADRTAGL